VSGDIAQLALGARLALACVFGLARAPSESAPMPAAAERAIVIGSVTPEYDRDAGVARTGAWVQVAGRWSPNAGWHQFGDDELSDPTTARRLVPEAAKWLLYQVSQPVGSATGEAVTLVPEETEVYETARGPEIHVALHGLSARIEASGLPFLAAFGVRHVDDPQVRQLALDDLAACRLATEARPGRGGLSQPKVTQHLAVDLDGDRRVDRLVAADPAADGAGVLPAWPMVLVGLDRGRGRMDVTVLTASAEKEVRRYASDPDYPHITSACTVAVADLDGDGFREIMTEYTAPDMTGCELHSFDGKRFRRVLSWMP
jgi:hypothetical protein